MKNLYLIIIAFVFGILIYTILPKFCGCDRVLEGHGEHDNDDHYEKIYHLLNTLPWYENENDYNSMSGSFSDWTNITCQNSESIPTSMYKHIDMNCSHVRKGCNKVNQFTEYPRLLICQLERYHTGNSVLKEEFQYNLRNINIVDVDLTVNEDVIKFAKVAHRFIKKLEYIHNNINWWLGNSTGGACTHVIDGSECAWWSFENERTRRDAPFWNYLKLGIMNEKLNPPSSNRGVNTYKNYTDAPTVITKVADMHH